MQLVGSDELVSADAHKGLVFASCGVRDVLLPWHLLSPQSTIGSVTTTGQPGVTLGAFGSYNFSLALPPYLLFTAANWNVPQTLFITPYNDSSCNGFTQQVIQLDYDFVSTDPFYSSVLHIIPSEVVVTDSNGGCNAQYSCTNGVRLTRCTGPRFPFTFA